MAHILIVDDSATDAKLFSAMLERAGHKVSHAVDAESGIARAKSEIPDLILMDVIMPGMNGFELCKQIRALPGYRSTPVIFVTSHGDFESRSKGILSGANDLIAKPVLPIELAVKSVAMLLKNNLETQRAP